MSRPTNIVRNEEFERETVNVDDTLFINCLFTKCRIVFEGTGPVSFEGCTFDTCDWIFAGPAANVLLYLSALSNGLDEGGQKLVEGILERVRQGTVAEGIISQEPALRG